MNKIIGIIIVSLIVGILTWGFSGHDYVYEEAIVTDYKHESFLDYSITTVKFSDGDIRICKHLPYRDKGDIVIARKSRNKFWKLK